MTDPITRYRFGQVVIHDVTYTKDLVVFPDQQVSRWTRQKGHDRIPDDFQQILDHPTRPDTLIIGTGCYGLMQVPHAVQSHLQSHGIQLIIEPTETACATYNRLQATDQAIAAVFHLNC